MPFQCLDKSGSNYDANWLFLKDAWVPVITVCEQSIKAPNQIVVGQSAIPDLTNYTVFSNGSLIYVSWDPSNIYYTQGSYNINGGDWVLVGADLPGYNSDYYDLTNSVSLGDVVGFRCRFGSTDGALGSWKTLYTTITPHVIFKGISTPDITVFQNSTYYEDFPQPNYTIEGNNVLIDHPEYIVGFSCSNTPIGEFWVGGCQNLNWIEVSTNDPNEPGFSLIEATHCINLQYIECYGFNNLNHIELRGCTDFIYIYCEYTSLSSIIFYSNMQYVNLENNNLTSILAPYSIGNHKSIWQLQYNQLSADALNAFFISLIPGMTGEKKLIRIENNPGALNCDPMIATDKGWNVSGGPVQMFTGSATITLSDFSYTGTAVLMEYENNIFIDNPLNLVTLNLSNKTMQGILTLNNYNNLTSVNISGCSGITDLEIQNCSSLTTVNIDHSGLTTINGANCTYLTGTLDCTGCTALSTVYVQNDGLTGLIAPPNLSTLIADGCPIGTIDVHDNTVLSTLSVNGCSLSSISIHGCSQLNYLYASTNPLTSVDFSDCKSLITVSLSDTNITSLDLSPTSSYLQNLDLHSCTALSSLSLINFTALVSVNVNNCNNCTSLSVTNSNETQIYAAGAGLVALDITSSPNLNTLQIQNNNLNNTVLNAVFEELPTLSGTVSVGSNPGTGTCDTTIATGKGWTVN